MASNPYVNRVELADGRVLMDLTGDTVTAAKLLSGATAHDASGAAVSGTLYGIGSLYCAADSASPATVLGIGTWRLIRVSAFTWGDMARFTWGAMAQDTWNHDAYLPTVYVWQRTA